MKKNRGVFIGLVCMGLMLFPACGGTGETVSEKSASEVKQEVSKEKEETPEAVGVAIGTIYVDAMKKVTEMGKEQLPFDQVKPKLIEFKNNSITKLVALGKIREGFSDQDKAKVNITLRKKIREVDSIFTQYSDAIKFYFKNDAETYALFSSFNIITQYADYELLKKQNQKEAERLGIK